MLDLVFTLVAFVVIKIAFILAGWSFGGPVGIVAALLVATWRLRAANQTWADLGLRKPEHLWVIPVSTLVIFITIGVVFTQVLAPVLAYFGLEQGGIGAFAYLHDNLVALILTLVTHRFHDLVRAVRYALAPVLFEDTRCVRRVITMATGCAERIACRHYAWCRNAIAVACHRQSDTNVARPSKLAHGSESGQQGLLRKHDGIDCEICCCIGHIFLDPTAVVANLVIKVNVHVYQTGQ